MELTSSRTIAAPLARVWDALNDPATLKECIPGCETIERDGDAAYRITIAAKVGPVSARFTGRIEIAEIDAPRAYTMRFEGEGGAAGFAKGQARVTLASVDAATTTLSYAASAQIGGKLAQIGSRLIDAAASSLAEDFFSRFDAAVSQAKEAPAQVGNAAGQAPGQRIVRYVALVAITVLLVYLYLRGRG